MLIIPSPAWIIEIMLWQTSNKFKYLSGVFFLVRWLPYFSRIARLDAIEPQDQQYHKKSLIHIFLYRKKKPV